MKACKNCKSPLAHVELSSVIRFLGFFDLFRCILLICLMIPFFLACTKVHPMFVPLNKHRHKTATKNIMLYESPARDLSNKEYDMLSNIEQTCGHDYLNNFPAIWNKGEVTLKKSLVLLGISLCLPVLTAPIVLVYHKKNTISAVVAIIHFSMEIISGVFGVYGAYFFNDFRLCFLAHFSEAWKIALLVFIINIAFAMFYKLVILLCFRIYVRHYCKARSFEYVQPTAEEELKCYLKELKEMNIAPNFIPDLPDDKNKRDWPVVKATIKKMLVPVRLQMAELNSDDPVVENLIRSGKLHAYHEHHLTARLRVPERQAVATSSEQRQRASSGPNILKIARQMASRNAEYKLLKLSQKSTEKKEDHEDDVEIILPQSTQEFEDD